MSKWNTFSYLQYIHFYSMHISPQYQVSIWNKITSFVIFLYIDTHLVFTVHSVFETHCWCWNKSLLKAWHRHMFQILMLWHRLNIRHKHILPLIQDTCFVADELTVTIISFPCWIDSNEFRDFVRGMWYNTYWCHLMHRTSWIAWYWNSFLETIAEYISTSWLAILCFFIVLYPVVMSITHLEYRLFPLPVGSDLSMGNHYWMKRLAFEITSNDNRNIVILKKKLCRNKV